jgi:hypothetical protein
VRYKDAARCIDSCYFLSELDLPGADRSLSHGLLWPKQPDIQGQIFYSNQKSSGNIQSTTVITVAKTYLFMLNSVVQWVGVEPVRVKGLNGLQKGLWGCEVQWTVARTVMKNFKDTRHNLIHEMTYAA